jgi:hypothetical protein
MVIVVVVVVYTILREPATYSFALTDRRLCALQVNSASSDPNMVPNFSTPVIL